MGKSRRREGPDTAPLMRTGEGVAPPHPVPLGLLCVCAQLHPTFWLFVTPWTVARQAPLSTGFPRQEYWSGLPCPPPGDLPDPGIEPSSPSSPALARGFFAASATREALELLGPGTPPHRHPPPNCMRAPLFRSVHIIPQAHLQRCPQTPF